MHRRLNRLSAILIDAFVADEVPVDIAFTARTFARYGIPLEVALRVLTRPSARRHVRTPTIVSTLKPLPTK